jgi:hypothetical protein
MTPIKTDNRTNSFSSTGRLLPEEGFVRMSAIIGPNGPIPVSKSTWCAYSDEAGHTFQSEVGH